MPRRLPLLTLLLLAVQAPTFAAPVVNSAAFATDVRVPSAGFTGLQTLWNVNVTSSDPCSGLSASFSRGGGSQSFSLGLDTDPVFLNCNFSQQSFTFADANALVTFAGLTTPWFFTVTDSTGSAIGSFPINLNPEVLPFAQNVLVSDASDTPAISWTLPDLTGFDVDRVRLRAIDEDLSGTIIYQVDLAPDATSYQIPDGVLQVNHRYSYVVMLDDLENGLLENRSRRRSAAPVAVVPEPGTLALIAVGLMGMAGLGRRKI